MLKIKYIFISIILFLSLYLIYKEFIYVNKYTIDKFDLRYNEFRKKNNIPLLPSDWVLDDKNNYSINSFHSPNVEKLGHRVKYINLLKSDLGAEMDKFYLTQDSVLESRYERNTENKLLYIYNSSSSETKLITCKEANELLKKYNINYNFDNSWCR